MSGEPPTKKARVSVEDSEMLPITEGTQDFQEFVEWSDNFELHGLQGKRLNVEMGGSQRLTFVRYLKD